MLTKGISGICEKVSLEKTRVNSALVRSQDTANGSRHMAAKKSARIGDTLPARARITFLFETCIEVRDVIPHAPARRQLRSSTGHLLEWHRRSVPFPFQVPRFPIHHP